MKKRLNKKSLILIIIILTLILMLFYITFFYKKKCLDIECFNTALLKCEKAYYLSDETDSVWEYKIKGKTAETCKVGVKLIQVKQGSIELKKMENEKMDCLLVLGSIEVPHENLNSCHGMLKEEIQNLLIKKLHNYIVDNIGEITEELQQVV